MCLPKHFQIQTSCYLLTFTLAHVCHNSARENVHQLQNEAGINSTSAFFSYSRSLLEFIQLNSQVSVAPLPSIFKGIRDDFLFPSVMQSSQRVTRRTAPLDEPFLDPENCCTRCTRRLKQQSSRDAPSASKPKPQIMSGAGERSCDPCSRAGWENVELWR